MAQEAVGSESEGADYTCGPSRHSRAVAVRASTLAILLCLSSPLWAAASAVVDAIRMPAWLDRGTRTVPLAPGLEVQAGDTLRTGEGARVYLKLGEGSTVKLGESAQFVVSRQGEDSGVFRAAFNVAAGAFRFTTAALQKLRKRDVAIRVGTATIGIRGTDVWGRSGKDQDLVMLIEGQVEVTPAQGPGVQLARPFAVFTAPKGGAAAPLGLATDEEFRARARETDILPGDGATTKGGRWRLVTGPLNDEKAGLAVYERLREAGYAAKIRPTATHYEVFVPGFADEPESRIAAAGIKSQLDLDLRPRR